MGLKGYVWRLKEGYEWNPLFKLPRNMLCPCGEEVDGQRRKLKKCCLKDAARAVTKSEAQAIRIIIAHDLERAMASGG